MAAKSSPDVPQIAAPSPSVWEKLTNAASRAKGFAVEYGRPAIKYAWIPILFVLAGTDIVEEPRFNWYETFAAPPEPSKMR